MFIRYDITSEEDKREALAKMQAHVEALAARVPKAAAFNSASGMNPHKLHQNAATGP